MECPRCQGLGWLGRVKVLSKNIMLRVCNKCSRTWPDGVDPTKFKSIKLSEFLKLKGLKTYDLIDVAEDSVKAS